MMRKHSSTLQHILKPQVDWVPESLTASNLIVYRLRRNEGIKITEPYGWVIFEIVAMSADIMNYVSWKENRIMD